MPNDTGKVIQNMIDSATDAGLKIPDTVTETPESVPKPPETVTETVDIVPENHESVTLPAEIVLEPKITKLVQEFDCNFEEIKTALSAKIEKYTGLVVTDENLKDMGKTKKEIAGLRINIGKFKLEVKRKLEKPYQEFELQIKELLDLVESVEKPIADQIEKYEVEREKRERAKIQGWINDISTECGLEQKYSSQIVIDEKWLNKTAKKKDIMEAIQTRVAWYLDIQSKERQAELFKTEKVEMAKILCQSLSVGLATPLTFEEIESRVEAMKDVITLKTFIEEEVARRKEREARAAQLAVEQAAATEVTTPPPAITYCKTGDVEAAPPPPPNYVWSNTVPEPPQQSNLPPMPPVMPPLPPMPPSAPAVPKWDVVLKLPGITVEQARGFKEYLAASGITYEIVSQEMVR